MKDRIYTRNSIVTENKTDLFLSKYLSALILLSKGARYPFTGTAAQPSNPQQMTSSEGLERTLNTCAWSNNGFQRLVPR